MAGDRKTKARIVAKIRKVMRDDPKLTREQALGKAFGILRGKGIRLLKPKRRRD